MAIFKFTVYTCFVRCRVDVRYGMANEKSFQSLSEERASDFSANKKRKGKARNARTGKSRISCDPEVDRLIELLEESRPLTLSLYC